jgi:hypothetical protein
MAETAAHLVDRAGILIVADHAGIKWFSSSLRKKGSPELALTMAAILFAIRLAFLLRK